MSLDQCELMSEFLNLTGEETEYFFDLQIYERASAPSLRKRYKRRIDAVRLERTQIKRAIGKATSEIGEVDQERFYSSYLYGLIHVLVSLPQFQTKDKLLGVLGVSSEVLDDLIQFLIRIGVLLLKGNLLLPGPLHVHLNKESKLIWRHHANWRLATLQKCEFGDKNNLHYSLVFSCSEQDAQLIREKILKQLSEINTRIADSKEEAAFVYCFDFYKWK